MSIDALISGVRLPHRCRFACHCLERVQGTPRFDSLSQLSSPNHDAADSDSASARSRLCPHPSDMTILRNLAQLRQSEQRSDSDYIFQPPSKLTYATSTDTDTGTPKPCPLLCLPYEIRHLILIQLLTSPFPISFIYIRQHGRLKVPSPCPNALNPSVLRTCSQLYAEGEPILYDSNIIELTHTTSLNRPGPTLEYRPGVYLPKRWYECESNNATLNQNNHSNAHTRLYQHQATLSPLSSSLTSFPRIRALPRLFWPRIKHLKLTLRTTNTRIHRYQGRLVVTRALQDMRCSVENLVDYINRDQAELRTLRIELVREGNWRITGGGGAGRDGLNTADLREILKPLSRLWLLRVRKSSWLDNDKQNEDEDDKEEEEVDQVRITVVVDDKEIERWLVDDIFSTFVTNDSNKQKRKQKDRKGKGKGNSSLPVITEVELLPW